jgi:glutamyl endopeptidase
MTLALVDPTSATAQGQAVDAIKAHETVASDGTVPPAFESTDPADEASSEGSGEVAKAVPEESASEIWRLLELKTLDGPIGIESIIPPDDRRRVSPTTGFPYRAIVLVTSDAGRCTGWLYGRDVVATAGHCVHSGGSGGAWYSNVRVYPGRDGQASPYGSCTAKRLYSVRGWTDSKSEQYDYGAIKLNCRVGDQTGWFGFFWQDASLNNLATEVAGYPGDKPLQQWMHRDRVRASEVRQVFYQNDTAPGNSGGPVFYSRPNCGVCSMAVHAYGLHGSNPHANNNHGSRITRECFQNLVSWRNAN